MPQRNSSRKVKSNQQLMMTLELRASGASFRSLTLRSVFHPTGDGRRHRRTKPFNQHLHPSFDDFQRGSQSAFQPEYRRNPTLAEIHTALL
jgi:hypothetical protein